jgi:hypothetical protein
MSSVQVFDNLVDEYQCDIGITIIEELKKSRQLFRRPDGRGLLQFGANAKPLEIPGYKKEFIYDYVKNVIDKIYEVNPEIKDLVLGDLIFTYYTPGSYLEAHRDDYNAETNTLYTAVLYLNDNYTGGELEFPESNLKYKPKTGCVVVIDNHELHKVNTILEGKRYIIGFGFVNKSEVHFNL